MLQRFLVNPIFLEGRKNKLITVRRLLSWVSKCFDWVNNYVGFIAYFPGVETKVDHIFKKFAQLSLSPLVSVAIRSIKGARIVFPMLIFLFRKAQKDIILRFYWFLFKQRLIVLNYDLFLVKVWVFDFFIESKKHFSRS